MRAGNSQQELTSPTLVGPNDGMCYGKGTLSCKSSLVQPWKGSSPEGRTMLMFQMANSAQIVRLETSVVRAWYLCWDPLMEREQLVLFLMEQSGEG